MKLDEERAITAIPRLLPDDPRERNIARTAILRVLGARGDLPEQSKLRLERIEALFSAPAEARGVADKQPLPVEG